VGVDDGATDAADTSDHSGEVRLHAHDLTAGLQVADSRESDAVAGKRRTGGFRNDALARAVDDAVDVGSFHA
jgi:hypothetical protein